MLKKITMILTSEIGKKLVIFIAYIFVVMLALVVIYQTFNKSSVERRTMPEEAFAIIEQEIQSFQMLPGSKLITNPTTIKERIVAVQATHSGSGSYDAIRTYYIEEAERNGWVLIEEDIKKTEITFSKSDVPKSNYGLKMCFNDVDVILYFYWISGY